MLVLVACVLALLSPLVAGRWPASLLLNRWKWPLLIWATLIFQTLVLVLPMPHGLAAVLHVASYAAAIWFLWLNRHFPGVWFVGAGAFSNGVVIALNGGTLPASADAVARAGIDHGTEFANSAVLENPTLLWLGDVFAWPAPLPLANTFSVGDVLIVVGAVVAAWSGSRRIGARDEAPAEGQTESG
ncbi:DUF5317 domain-containing protein [Demequina sp.]|uniref:DUF5317 domain-containing protein n=1 Tax=Demequina sp. TaxID=2050685 RepID=UPI003D0D2A3D